MRSMRGWIRSLVLPSGAGSGTPRVVIGPDVPAELTAEYGAGRVLVGRIYYNATGLYHFDALILAPGDPAPVLGVARGFWNGLQIIETSFEDQGPGPQDERSFYVGGRGASGLAMVEGHLFNTGDADFYGTTTFDAGGSLTVDCPATFADFTQVGDFNPDVITCRMFQTVAQSIPNGGTGTAITFTQADQDSAGGWSALTPTRYTFPSPGLYEVTGGVAFVANATATRYCYLLLNGASATPIQRVTAVSGLPTTLETTHLIPVAAADEYVELMATQASGGALNTAVLTTVPVTLSYMYVKRVREYVS